MELHHRFKTGSVWSQKYLQRFDQAVAKHVAGIHYTVGLVEPRLVACRVAVEHLFIADVGQDLAVLVWVLVGCFRQNSEAGLHTHLTYSRRRHSSPENRRMDQGLQLNPSSLSAEAK